MSTTLPVYVVVGSLGLFTMIPIFNNNFIDNFVKRVKGVPEIFFIQFHKTKYSHMFCAMYMLLATALIEIALWVQCVAVLTKVSPVSKSLFFYNPIFIVILLFYIILILENFSTYFSTV